VDPLYIYIVGWRGVGCVLSCSPEDLLNKNVNNTHIFIKSSLKSTFLGKTPETKKFVEIFCEAFLTV
jgi:hypothetical protein